jgi:anaerobic ribonucleoside-triphosphate reductase activating protein
MDINLAGTLPRSSANGPGTRFVVWVQGCPLACNGCWNPDMWPFVPRTVRSASDLIAEVASTVGIEGITFSGGEPFSQARALALVARAAQDSGLSVFVFTGYELDDLKSASAAALLSCTDVLVTGRYLQALRTDHLPWRGSTNQRVIFLTERYSVLDMPTDHAAEFHVAADGTVTVTGFPSETLLGG